MRLTDKLSVAGHENCQNLLVRYSIGRGENKTTSQISKFPLVLHQRSLNCQVSRTCELFVPCSKWT